MSVVLCLPAHLRVSRSVPWPAPHGAEANGAEATAKLFLLITVLLQRYSAAGWPGLWSLRPYLDFWATGAPALLLEVSWGIWGFQLFLCPFPDKCSRWDCIINNFAILAMIGSKSSLGALSSPSQRPPSSTSLLLSPLVTMAETFLVWLSIPIAFRYFAGTVGA